MPKGIPLTEEMQEKRREEIFAASVHLFLKNGFNETSLREIAEAAGIGKSTLYDYYKTKDDILVSYYEKEIEKTISLAKEVYLQDLKNREKLTRIMQNHLAYILKNKKHFWRLSMEAQRLSIDSQNRVQAKRYVYQDLLRQVVEDGIQAGEFRPINPQIVARSILNLLTVAAFTTRPTGTPEEMLEEILSMCFNGISA